MSVGEACAFVEEARSTMAISPMANTIATSPVAHRIRLIALPTKRSPTRCH
jgi:hypothetical protein